MERKVNVAVLVSGGGTNLQALIDFEKDGKLASGKIVKVISGKEGAYALTRAESAGIKTAVVCKKDFATPREFEDRMIEILDSEGIELIVLAGFMSILSADRKSVV